MEKQKRSTETLILEYSLSSSQSSVITSVIETVDENCGVIVWAKTEPGTYESVISEHSENIDIAHN